MTSFTILLAIIFLIYIIYFIYKENDVVYVKSNVDNNTYIIRRGHSKDQKYLQDSADILAHINQRIILLITHLDAKFITNNDINHNIEKLKTSFNHSILSEAAIDKRYTTFTVNKQDMHICLRTRDSHEKPYDINTLMYVILHELAHLCNYNKEGDPITGHGDEFKKIFKFLVKEAINLQIYEYIDYQLQPKEYCGIMITTQIV